MNICVFSSGAELEETYTKPAETFARLLAQNGHSLVCGASDRGMMKVVADTASQLGAHITGITTKMLAYQARGDKQELLIEEDLGARKAQMQKRSDAFAALPGGLGTLDEIAEMMELKKHRVHDKPIVFLNTAGFYEGLKMQLERMEQQNFLPRPLRELVFFATTPEEAMEYIERNAKG
ncbi:MAG TPA: TIGR00730 family Rossman fold protein [Candidatus Paceibacterota bacterium]|nr:TIGR00730 family Rossman fold protein [Candidatus Paceibacterota bacterium]